MQKSKQEDTMLAYLVKLAENLRSLLSPFKSSLSPVSNNIFYTISESITLQTMK